VEYRIEELSRRSGVGVDTIRFYQGRGLLPPPRRAGRVTWYSAGHEERLDRIRALQDQGFSLAVIRRFLEGELEPPDEALVVAVTHPETPSATLTRRELATQSGVPESMLQALESVGLLTAVAGTDPPRYAAGEHEALRAGLRLLEAGIPLAEVLRLGQAYALATADLAAEAVTIFDRNVRERILAGDADPATAATELVAAFDALLTASGTLVRHHFQRTLRAQARARIEGLAAGPRPPASGPQGGAA